LPWTTTDYDPTDFANRRHIGPSPAEMEEMLRAVRADSLDALIAETVPGSIRQDRALDWAPMAESELLAHMREIAAKNRPMVQMIGQGYYGTHTPPASSATCWRTRPGTPPTRPTSLRSRKGGSRRC
jgi:glycine dehydrogenase